MTKSEWISDRIQLWNIKEVRNRDTVYPWYLAVSEDCINEKMHQHFPQNSLMFAWACLTLKDNPSLWNILKNKGLGCYFGYDDTVYTPRALNDLWSIMQRMLGDRLTAHEAYSQIGSGVNPHFLLYPSNSNIVLVEGDWVDLGLPSGLLWATRNVGASSPTDYGDRFAWGEISPRIGLSGSGRWYDYQWWGGDDSYGTPIITKYNTKSIYGSVDNLTTLQPVDDAATVNYGGRMPTKEEWQELLSNTTSTWTTINGVKGRSFTGPNGSSLFLPADGYPTADGYTVYWSSSLYTDCPALAWGFAFGWDNWMNNDFEDRLWGCFRCELRSVRAVRQP